MTEITLEPQSSSSSSVAGDSVLRDFRSALARLYGPRLTRLMLFGSRARGRAREDSDYDVAVFLRDMTDRWAEFDRLNAIATDILYRGFAVVHALPYDERSYRENPSTLRCNIREEGVEL